MVEPQVPSVATEQVLPATLILKTLVVPALIGLTSWVARRWGHDVGGWLVALPLTSGPVMLILALERGRGFARQACIGALLAIISLSAFALAYGWLARSLSWRRSSTLACAAYLACTWLLQFPSAPGIGWIFAITCVVLAVTIRLMPTGLWLRASAPTPPWDIPLRMVLAAVIVWGLARAAGNVGPRMSGLLTPFPIAATILAAFTHHFEGSAAAGQFLRSLLMGLFSFAVFLLMVGLALTQYTVIVGFAAATLGTLAFHAGAWRWVHYRLRQLHNRGDDLHE
jgi:hypothetical protein